MDERLVNMWMEMIMEWSYCKIAKRISLEKELLTLLQLILPFGLSQAFICL
jgi:hypothetical protein